MNFTAYNTLHWELIILPKVEKIKFKNDKILYSYITIDFNMCIVVASSKYYKVGPHVGKWHTIF